jgi:thiopeptide-type bacteriocin biosynthesis protein
MMETTAYDDVRSADHRWFSVHLESGSTASVYGEPFDQFAIDILQHIARGPLARAPRFFVRYSDPRPHLRIRARVPRTMGDDEAMEEVGLREAGQLGLFADAVLCPYEPEIARYGGPRAVPLAETAFCASSDLALARVLTFRDRPRSARIGAGILESYAMLHAAYPRAMIGRVAAWLRDGWIRLLAKENDRYLELFDASLEGQVDTIAAFIEEADDSLTKGEGVGPDSHAFQSTWSTVVRAYQGLAWNGQLVFADDRSINATEAQFRLIPPFLHMTHNRMGLTRLEEAYIAHALAEACQRGTAATEQLANSDA